MGAFGSVSLADKIGIILGCLIGLILVAGLIKFYMNKRRLKKTSKIANLEAAAKMTDMQKLVGKKPEEGEFCGVRAIEHGYFGGVDQSKSNSPTPSYILSPSTTVVDWGKGGVTGSPAGSIRSLDMQWPTNMSVSSLSRPEPVRSKPSPLRLHPSDAELNRRRNHSFSSVDGIEGTYMPPLPSPRSLRSGTPDSLAPSTAQSAWVSPLDVHFSRPSTPNGASRPPSYLPRLQFPVELEKNMLLVPTPSGSDLNSEAASIVNSVKSEGPQEATPAQPEAVAPPPVEASTFSVLPQTVPSWAARQSQRPIFPVSDETERPPSRRSPNESPFPIPLIPQDLSPSRSPTIDHEAFFPKPGPWSPERPIIRDSVVSKQRVSVYRPQKTQFSRETSPEAQKSRSRAPSIAASSIYSTTTATLDTRDTTPPSQTQQYSHIRSRSTDQRNRSCSTSSQHTRALSRTEDSLRRHSRKISQNRSTSKTDKHRSRERDQIHYDPTHHRRNRSSSVQGRAVDFDHPRESPFSNSNAVSGSGNEKGERHSVNSSVSTTFSTFSSIYVETRAHVKSEERKEWELIPPRNQRLELDLRIDSERLSVNPLMPSARGRSASEVSQVSIGDFYDAYYRQSILAHRASVASQTQAIDVKMAGAGTELLNLANGGNGNGGLGMGGGKRPPPMNFSRGGAGIGLKPPGTIVELPSPLESPVLGKERFPTRI